MQDDARGIYGKSMAVATFETEAPSSLNETVSRNVRVLMAASGVTQSRLAEVLHVSQSGVSNRLRGSVPWSVADLQVVAEAFGVGPEVLVSQGLPRLDSNQQPAGYGYSYALPTAA